MKMHGFAIASLLAILATCPGVLHAADPPNFDFLGHVVSVPSQSGQTLTLYAVINNNGVVPTPIPFDFANAEHTLVLEATLSNSNGNRQQYTPASVRLYSDAGPATAHDFANASTFTDGTLVLEGAFRGNLTRQRFSALLGSIGGSIDWTGGSRVGELGDNASDWSFGGGTSQTLPRPGGYAETWDGLIQQGAVAVDQQTWSAVKDLFKR